mgnify:CR=1 FL=1
MRITLHTGTPAEIARPAGVTPARGLVMWPDIRGLRPLFDQHAQRVADAEAGSWLCRRCGPAASS